MNINLFFNSFFSESAKTVLAQMLAVFKDGPYDQLNVDDQRTFDHVNQVIGAQLDADDFHWFISSCLNWHVGTDLFETLTRQKKADQPRSGYKASTAYVYRVPGPVNANYEIDNFTPQVTGTVCICEIEYGHKFKMPKGDS